MFFGQSFGWAPSQIDNLKWSWRKQMRQAYEDSQKEMFQNK